MEIRKEDEIEDISMSPPLVGSMRIGGCNNVNDFGHNKEFMSHAYLKNNCSEIDIQIDDSSFNQNRPLPIFLKVLGSNGFIVYQYCYLYISV